MPVDPELDLYPFLDDYDWAIAQQYQNEQIGGVQYPFQDVAQTTAAGLGDPVGSSRGLAGTPAAAQDVDGDRPVWADGYLDFDGASLKIDLPEPVTGSLIVGTTAGCLAMTVDLPAGEFSIEPSNLSDEIVGVYLSTTPLSQAEAQGVIDDLIAQGASDEAFGGVTNFGRVFRRRGDLISIDTEIDTSSALSLFQTFDEAANFDSDISGWDVSGVGNFVRAFHNAGSFDQDLGGWDLSSATSLSGMLTRSGLSVENYSRTLIGWANFVFNNTGSPSGITLGAAGLQYDDTEWVSGEEFNDAVSARAYLTTTAGWSISDAGEA